MIRAILFDVDGLIIAPRKELFSLKFAREYSIPVDSVNGFFLNNFKKCSLGQADLKEEIEPFLSKWQWKGSGEDFLAYWFQSESEKNETVLSLVSSLRSKGVRCYLATGQEKYRLQYLLDNLELSKYFDGAFCTCDIQYSKKEKEFYEYILEKLNLPPEEVLFFDDGESSIKTARDLGIEAYLYESLEMLKKHTDQIIGS